MKRGAKEHPRDTMPSVGSLSTPNIATNTKWLSNDVLLPFSKKSLKSVGH
jgi:hypothetical protein